MNLALNRILKLCFMFSFLVMGFLWCFADELSTFIYPGKNFLVNFYLRSVFGKIRAKSFNYSLELFQNRIAVSRFM